MTTISVDLVRFRPSHIRQSGTFVAKDRRAMQAHPGNLLARSLAVGQRRHHGFRLPPNPLDRVAFGVWESSAAANAHLRSDLHRRWEAAGAVSTLVLQPYAARGTWGADDLQLNLGEDPPPGPVAILTYGELQTRDLPRFYLRDSPRVYEEVRRSPDLVASLGCASWDLHAAMTVTVWRECDGFQQPAYGRGTAHRAVIGEYRSHLRNSTYVRCSIVSASGIWETARSDRVPAPGVARVAR